MTKTKINKNHFRVAIFGSARLKRAHPTYKLVHRLARFIGEEGIDVVTGGGPGLMDAASRGHHQGQKKCKDSESIGLTIKLPREQRDGYHLDIKKEFDKFSGRLDTFMELSNVVVVAPGGIGTILEFFYTWQLIQVGHMRNIPIILLGDVWPGLIEWVKKKPLRKKLLSKEDVSMLYFAKNTSDAMKIITEARDMHTKKGKNFCLNYTEYRA